jgi:membrane protein implicated in regulation of membrane protease activity
MRIALSVLALVAMLSGLALAVRVAFFGVERRRGGQIRRPHPAINTPALAATLFVWGAVTYALQRLGPFGPAVNAVLALPAAAGVWVGTGFLLAKWALRAPVVDPHEEAELLQGHVATVVKRITAAMPGAITFYLDGESRTVEARSLDSRPIDAGTDVVIERIDANTAYVEPWSLVERRL